MHFEKLPTNLTAGPDRGLTPTAAKGAPLGACSKGEAYTRMPVPAPSPTGFLARLNKGGRNRR